MQSNLSLRFMRIEELKIIKTLFKWQRVLFSIILMETQSARRTVLHIAFEKPMWRNVYVPLFLNSFDLRDSVCEVAKE